MNSEGLINLRSSLFGITGTSKYYSARGASNNSSLLGKFFGDYGAMLFTMAYEPDNQMKVEIRKSNNGNTRWKKGGWMMYATGDRMAAMIYLYSTYAFGYAPALAYDKNGSIQYYYSKTNPYMRQLCTPDKKLLKIKPPRTKQEIALRLTDPDVSVHYHLVPGIIKQKGYLNSLNTLKDIRKLVKIVSNDNYVNKKQGDTILRDLKNHLSRVESIAVNNNLLNQSRRIKGKTNKKTITTNASVNKKVKKRLNQIKGRVSSSATALKNNAQNQANLTQVQTLQNQS